jgi:ABC-type Mn2+/Zn2+ transport system permease subunit
MFWLAPLVGTLSVLVGLALAYRLDWPSGPAIVLVAGLVFLSAWGIRTWRASRGMRR